MNAKERRRQRREALRAAEKAEQAAEEVVQNAAESPAQGGPGAQRMQPLILEGRALRVWPARLESIKEKALDETGKVLEDKNSSAREKAAATRNVIAMSGQELELGRRLLDGATPPSAAAVGMQQQTVIINPPGSPSPSEVVTNDQQPVSLFDEIRRFAAQLAGSEIIGVDRNGIHGHGDQQPVDHPQAGPRPSETNGVSR